MIKGIGIDIIEIERIKGAVLRFGEQFLNRVFTEKEISYCKRRKELGIPELSVRFAAKEAYSKALGVGIKGFGRSNQGVSWKDVEVVNNSLGKPLIAYKGKVEENTHIRLSHRKEFAVATVYVEE